ncbi:MAG: hypothetical protein LBI18_13185 [Planctomycetaceae bacterium]|jgi:hypothetical protein|nr:hypothetical protein [Planctomycetaceae bacterium]
MLTTTNLPIDSVEMVRSIRRKHYEETKGMSPQERYLRHSKKVVAFKEYCKKINHDKGIKKEHD